MKELNLVNSWRKALVDDDDYDRLNQYKWKLTTNGYVKMCGSTHSILLHHMVIEIPHGMEPDHINRNKLDHRKENLRAATHAQNMANMKKHERNSSSYRGVYPHGSRWRAYITTNGRNCYLGMFDSQEDAAKAYNERAVLVFGKFAQLNQIS